jgi:hypothetical protein
MIDYKYPTIAAGATPIGSAERAPYKKNKRISNKDEESYDRYGMSRSNISTTMKL